MLDNLLKQMYTNFTLTGSSLKLSQAAGWGDQTPVNWEEHLWKREEHTMTALSNSFDARRKDGALALYALGAGVHVHKGGLLGVVSATGLVQPVSDTAGLVFVGVAYEESNNTGGAAGAKTVRVLKTGIFTYAKAAAVQADTGKTAFAVDDGTVSTAATTDSIACGVVVGAPDGLTVQIRIDGKVN